MTTRIYAVENGDGAVRLVRAGNPSQAVRHVARSMYTARVASQDDIVRAVTAGAKVEDAKEEAE